MYNRLKTAFVVLVVMCCFAAVGHANNLTVFDGTQVSPYVPLPTANYNVPGTRGQVIYPASELTAMVGQPISAITLYVNNEGCKMNGGALRVSMGEVEESVFSAPSFFTELTTVALAEMRTGLEEIDIDFDTPYIYGGGNLVIDFYVQVAGSSEAYNFTYFYGLFQQGHTSMTTGDEGNEYREFIPKTTFEYGETPAYSAKTSPRHVTFNTIRSGESDVYTIYLKNNGLNAFTATVSADAPFSASMPAGGLLEPGATQEIVVAFEPVVAGTFDGVLSIDCGQAGVLEVPLSGTALENGTDFTVCDGTSTNAKLPFNGVYFSDAGTYGQMIYPADMLADITGSKIVALSFYTNKPTVLKDGTVQISLKETDQSEFTSKVAVADMTPVASMPLSKGLEVITFYFDTPYKYMGGNLAVEARVMDSNGNYGTTQFYGEVTDYNAGLSVTHSQWSGDNAELIKFLPKVTFTCQADAALPGDVNNDSEVNISDVIKLINAVLNDDFTEVNLVNADLDNNNEVNISDVIDLINKVLNNN